MIGDSINFGDKNINKSNFYRNKNLYKIDDTGVNKNLFLRKNHMVIRNHLNTLFDAMIIMPLDHYV